MRHLSSVLSSSQLKEPQQIFTMSGGAAAVNGAAVATANGGSALGADPAAATIFMEPTNEVVVQFNNISCWVPRLDMGKKGLLEVRRRAASSLRLASLAVGMHGCATQHLPVLSPVCSP